MELVDFIKAHVDDINGYKQKAFSWKQKRDGEPYKAIAEVMARKGPMVVAFKDVPEKLDRQIVANIMHKDLYKGFVAALLWGGMHKSVNQMRHFLRLSKVNKKELVEKLEAVKKLLKEKGPGEALVSMMRSIITDQANENHISGIGISYATKIIYFLSCDMTLPVKPLIYDKYLAFSHCALLTDRGEHIPYYLYDGEDNVLRQTIYILAHTSEIYTHYCKLMAKTAKDCGIKKVDDLEAWLFGWPISPKNKEENPRYVSKMAAMECEKKNNENI